MTAARMEGEGPGAPSEEEDDGPRVGPRFQAEIPPPDARAAPPASGEGQLVWSPLAESGAHVVDGYLARAHELLAEPRLQHTWQEIALNCLHDHGGDVDAALAMLPLEEDLARGGLWSDAELNELDAAAKLHRDDLEWVHRSMGTKRAAGEVVAQAYLTLHPLMDRAPSPSDGERMPLRRHVRAPHVYMDTDCAVPANLAGMLAHGLIESGRAVLAVVCAGARHAADSRARGVLHGPQRRRRRRFLRSHLFVHVLRGLARCWHGL